MKFENLMSKTYWLLEQDENLPPDAAMPQDGVSPEKQKASDEIEKTGEKMSTQVDSAMEGLVLILQKVMSFIKNEERVGNAKFPPMLSKLFDDIKNYTLDPKAVDALKNIEDSVTEVENHYSKNTTVNSESVNWRSYIAK